jgi:hypothetical protein
VTPDSGSAAGQGSKLVRWAAIEACQRTRPCTKLAADRSRIITAGGRNIGVVAAARRLLTLVFYGLRDGQIRALAVGGRVSRNRTLAWRVVVVMTPDPRRGRPLD